MDGSQPEPTRSWKRLPFLRRPPLSEAGFLLAVFLLALGLRLAWIAYANYDPNDGRFGDDLFYDFMARGLAAGKGYLSAYNAQTALWPPGYSLILAGLYKAVGHSIISAKVLNAVSASVTVVLVYFIGARVFSKKVGGVAAVMLAVFPGQIYYSTLILNESLFAFFSTLILLFSVIWISKGRGVWPPALLLLGILFGWAALMRSEALVLLVATLLVWTFAAPSWRAFAGQGMLVVLGAAIAIAPWMARNEIAMHGFIPISSGGGHTFLAGHLEDPYGTPYVFPAADLWLKYPDLPYPQRELKMEREAWREGLDFAKSHPSYEVQLVGEKFYQMYKDDSEALLWIEGAWPNPGNLPWLQGSWVAERPEPTPVIVIPRAAERNWARLADRYYFAVLACGLVGVPLWFSVRDKKRLLLILTVVLWTALHLVFIPNSRYHVSLAPVFCLWAATSLVFVFDLVKRRLTRNRKESASP
ncbi:MAG: glycosyltransferase family 39 protein [Dehalococcoidia bacterium]